uniref:ADAM metallopeptidase with thrombospondin type 1 motif 7 n=1 Tax=Takifugu rubripes TaxID=31033 RepID=H2V0N4_TAKRU
MMCGSGPSAAGEYKRLIRHERLLLDLPQYDVVHPTRVDARGHFLSNFLSHHARRVQRREAPEGSANMDRVFYQLWHSNHSLRFNLTLNTHLLAPGFLTERRYGGLEGAKMQTAASSQCHFLGEVWDEDSVKGSAAISTCDGLTGLFRLSKEEFFIQPLQKSTLETSAPQAHAIYKRHANAETSISVIPDSHQSLADFERHRERWERRRLRKRRRIRQRSVSKEKWVETLVVADPKMVEYHGSTAVENYILAVMNIVAGLFGDASIGNAINVVVVRLILLEQDEDDLKITHHADNSLHSFCKWQKKLNMKGDDHPLHHDVSVLLTRKDICAAINMPCETLGLSHVAGMCQAHRSCSISEDTGLPVAFTVAHELGHNFGIQHDGNGNDCEPVGKRPFVMSPQLLYGTSLPQWSRCSREYITRFLDRGWGWCLDDAPVKDKHSWNSVLPGVVYTAVHQCRLQYGPSSRLCDDMDNVCSTLWCTVGTTCHSKLDGAVDGTSCGEDKWCFRGECLHVGHQPAMINGGWGSWSEWSACSRTCGAGVQNAHRDCDNPVPKYRGTYCLGERRRYKICNITPCPQEVPTFRDVQCGHFNVLPYKGTFYKWETVFNKASPCELHCRPLNENFSEKLRDAVTDGTLCYEGNKSRDMCINGICMKVGCDYVVESSAVEDRCGVCNGDGSTCTTVRRTFEESEGLGYVDIGLIPEGARDIRIEEVAEAGNFLALRSDNPNKYFLNGGWTIQWNGDYKAAGTIFTYERTRHLENLTSPGPTTEPLWIQLLFQEPNPGVRYEYTINRNTSGNNSLPTSSFSWKFGSWTECSATCGAGRNIIFALPSRECEHVPKPASLSSCNTHIPCPADWTAGNWSKVSLDQHYDVLKLGPKKEIPSLLCFYFNSGGICSLTCGSGVRRRNITCSRNTGIDCDPQKKPTAVAICSIQDCPQEVDNYGDWSGSGWSSNDVLNEINSISDLKPPPRYSNTRAQTPIASDLNVLGDFHYHNNIENIGRFPESSVQVDDFYYDYNFINFHEDLEETAENGVEGSRVFGVPQDAGPTQMSSTAASEIAGIPKVTTESLHFPLEREEIADTILDPTGDNGNAGAENSKEWDDFLSEDYLLPVSPTHRPVVQHSQTQEERNNHLSVPTRDANGPEVENGLSFTEDSLTVNADASHTTISGIPNTLTSAPVGNDSLYVYDNYEESTVIPEDQETFQSVQLDESASEIPQTTSQSVVSASGFILEDLDSDHSDFSPTYATGRYSWDTDFNPTTASLSEEYMPTPLPYLQISGNHQASDISTSSGTATEPPTALEGATQVSPADLLPAVRKYDPTEPPSAERGGAEFSPQASWLDLEALDETPMPVMVTERSIGLPSAHPDPPTSTRPAVFWPTLLPTSVQTTASPQGTFSGYWITGNWSAVSPPIALYHTFSQNFLCVKEAESSPVLPQCSTSCGLGAIWRALSCSSGSDSDCDPAKRPAPAQRCYLRPCASWKVQEWSKCSRNCGGGAKTREVTCIDMRDERSLRPFHCRAVSSRPQTHLSCNLQPCLDWYASSWGQCSEVCGGGEQQRVVTCPEEDRCDLDLQPSRIQSCNNQLCVQWLTGSWGQCSTSCGGGVQRRLIKCINTKAETEVDASKCDHDLQPASTQKCNVQKCERTSSGPVCVRDRLTSRFCKTLLWLGRCQLPNIRAQCCKTCSQPPPQARSASAD